ncbi:MULTISPECIES: hypothetical protein [unclassified Corallococcus]|uniref:hypothetical protein n=1 Tax=unclassified Corallococcus TaxID=2685029 RepID=UPI001A8F5807|nr:MULTISPECIES: hypothetical protein [unclassified Corallococcus]MBN9681147.1 hypothetical protein [Corallococcus sp. NCSPR001]MBN9688584.1 hypothetical protein [Corallococcus sp. NCSPR001]WAS87271.1 hypothetical protein O0N60_09890 [Corallococcus sp. NCRR]
MEQVHSIIEIAGPLLLGLACGALFRKFVYPRILARLGSLAGWVTSAANTWVLLVHICIALGVAAACHASNSVATLMWLHENLSTPPFALTQELIHGFFLGATFLTGYYLAMFPASGSEEEQASGAV